MDPHAFCGRSVLTKRLEQIMTDRKILIIEDDMSMVEIIGIVLNDRNTPHDIFVRVKDTEQGLSFMDADGKTSIIDLDKYWVALVDSRLYASELQGVDIAKRLTAKGLPVIATSGLDSLNELIKQAGAIHAIRKDELFTGLLSAKIDLRQLVADAKKKTKAA